MKRASIIILIVTAAILIYAGLFYWYNLRGIWPAINKPSENISKVIENGRKPLKLKDNASISIFAKDLGEPRALMFAPGGSLLASITSQGKIVALFDRNSDGVSDETKTVIEGLNNPHGMAFRCDANENCKIYIAESDQVAEYDYDRENAKAIDKNKIFDLPDGGRHFTRTIMFMPSPNEDKLLVSVGSSCDVCIEKDSQRAKILVYDFKTKELKDFASGLRNSVFMAIHPASGKVWATEMGRDFLGDDLPPDEINIIKEGKNYGWPICYGKNMHDTDFDKNTYVRNPCMEPFEMPSYIDIPAHSAPLGLAFIPEEGWPQEYWHNLLVAYHGSWNRTEPTGYKIVRYKLDKDGNYLGEEDFIAGWLENGVAIGRPADILVQPGGVIYISDDKAGVVYRVVFSGK